MIGNTIAHYEVTGKLGEGGMGVVYRARDTKLGREVALKVLPAAFTGDAQRMRRLEREAHLLASLNHPHIAAIHGIEESNGVRALVIELVEGPTLADRIAAGPIPVQEALLLAQQIANALEYAHEQGVIHRDLKPANIKLTSDGAVKVLDFGLAKAIDEKSIGGDAENSPTLTVGSTHAGVILGTAAYMSPEQARGKNLDRRTDIWAFGAVFYEMLTGRAAFRGETVSDILAAVLTQEPDLALVPKDFRTLLTRCLEKKPARRLRDLGDLDLLLPKPERREPVPRRRTGIYAAVGLCAAAGALAAAFWMRAPLEPPAGVTRFVIRLGPDEELADAPAISPDGRLIAYVAQKGSGDPRLYIRNLSLFEPREVAASGGASQPFFSPDGNWLGFFARGQLQKVAVSGGAPVRVAPATFPLGGTFADDGSIVYVPEEVSGLKLIRPGAVKAEPLSAPDGGANGFSHTWPQALPGGEYVLFTIHGKQNNGVAALSLKTLRWQIVLPRAFGAVAGASSDSMIRLFVSDPAADIKVGQLDSKRPAPITAETTVLDKVYYQTGGSTMRTGLAVSRSGSAVYIPGEPGKRKLSWVDRTGRAETAFPEPAGFLHSVLSPDGTKVLATIGSDLWVCDLAAGTRRRLTFFEDSGSVASSPMWSPDGSRVIFGAQEGVDYDMYSQPADGSRPPELLLKRPFNQYAGSMTRDGVLLFGEGYPDHGEDLFALSPNGKVTPVRVTEKFNEVNGQFSPDGRRLAYQSDESGRNEIYVEDYPSGDHRAMVSAEGGTIPIWSRDGKELFYIAGDGVMVAPVESGGRPPLRLFGRSDYNFFWHSYDPSPDGKRLLMVRRDPGSAPRQLNVIVNWNEELQRLLPSPGKR